MVQIRLLWIILLPYADQIGKLYVVYINGLFSGKNNKYLAKIEN